MTLKEQVTEIALKLAAIQDQIRTNLYRNTPININERLESTANMMMMESQRQAISREYDDAMKLWQQAGFPTP